MWFSKCGNPGSCKVRNERQDIYLSHLTTIFLRNIVNLLKIYSILGMITYQLQDDQICSIREVTLNIKVAALMDIRA